MSCTLDAVEACGGHIEAGSSYQLLSCGKVIRTISLCFESTDNCWCLCGVVHTLYDKRILVQPFSVGISLQLGYSIGERCRAIEKLIKRRECYRGIKVCCFKNCILVSCIRRDISVDDHFVVIVSICNIYAVGANLHQEEVLCALCSEADGNNV